MLKAEQLLCRVRGLDYLNLITPDPVKIAMDLAYYKGKHDQIQEILDIKGDDDGE